MQEGIFSLMQMAKTAAAIDRFQKRGGLYISCLTHPTTGGVTASFASLGDIMLAEPGALIGFAGPRVIEQTIGEKLPEGFQSAEALLQNGFLDQIVPRDRWRAVLSQVLLLHEGKKEAQRCESKNRKRRKESARNAGKVDALAAGGTGTGCRPPRCSGLHRASFHGFF